MNVKLCLEYSKFAVLLLSAGTLGIMWWRRAFRDYYPLAGNLVVNILDQITTIPLLFFRKYLGISKLLDSEIHFYSSWFFFIADYTFLLLTIYIVFRLAVKPFEGLHRAGKIIFRWAFGVSAILSLGFTLGPRAVAGNLTHLVAAILQAMGTLTLCLLVFVIFVMRYLGITYRSRLFGVSVGIGIWIFSCLVDSVLSAHELHPSVYSPIFLVANLHYCAAVSIWGIYFAIPEPERKLILLPTTSPFFFWNRISEALGDDPGHVVVGGFKPEMLAPGELQVMAATSKVTNSKSQVVSTQGPPLEVPPNTSGKHNS